MAKLRPLPQSEVIKILSKNGFQQVRAGKHLAFKKFLPDSRVLTTWIPHHKEISVFVIQYIIKQTEKTRKEFEV
ncbi:type II toxin-antitoxin system HicA family toxin [Patescibacteria group bacterium]|nr:type II toxin-antitoxin system HicA family toxin [Patescibacteria group bacterium]